MGCDLNDHADGTEELNKHITVCLTVLKKLDLYWRHSDDTVRRRLVVYDAAARSKLVYGLESIQLAESAQEKLDIFQR